MSAQNCPPPRRFQVPRPPPKPFPFAPLTSRAYSVVVIDPPWRFRTWSETNQVKSASRHYDLMTMKEIIALPVRQLCADDCLFFLWATAPMLPQALSCMESWRITYKSNVVWRKITASGKIRMGLGFWARTMHEHVLIGSVGHPGKRATLPSLFDGVARQHSRKPDEFYAMVDRCTLAGRRADVFSREARPGWECWGHEAGKFDAGVEVR